MGTRQFGLAVGGIGEGALYGLDLARKHNREDVEAGRAEELHGLRTENLELGIESTEQGLEKGDLDLQISGLELEATQRAEATDKALRRFAAGDVSAVQDWYNEYADNDIDELARTADGGFMLRYSDGDEEKLTKDELGERVAAMADPQAWLTEMTMDEERFGGLQHHPELGWGQFGPDGKWVQHDPDSGTAGSGSGSDSELPGTVITSIRNTIDRKLRDALDANGLSIYSSEHGKELATLSERLGQRMYVNSNGQLTPVEAGDEAMMLVVEAQRRANADLGDGGQLTDSARQDWVRRRTREILGLQDSGLGPVGYGGGSKAKSKSDEKKEAIPSPTDRTGGGVSEGNDARPEIEPASSESADTSPAAESGATEGGTYVGADRNGQPIEVTWEMIQQTAEKHGKTPEEVISDLNLQPKQ